MQFKKRAPMKRPREEEVGSEEQEASGERSSSSSSVPSTIVVEEPDVRSQCQSHSPCTSDSDDGEEDGEERVSPPSSSASSACSGIYYNNSEVRFPPPITHPIISKPSFPALARLPPPRRQVPSGRPLACPPKLVITGGGSKSSSSSSHCHVSMAAPTNASISSSHCDYRKLQANIFKRPPSLMAVSPLLAATHVKKKFKSLERAKTGGPPKKRTVSFHLSSDMDECRADVGSFRLDGGGSAEVRGDVVRRRGDLSEDQRLFVEAAATLRQLGRQQQKQKPPKKDMTSRRAAAAGDVAPHEPDKSKSLAPAATLQRALPPPPSSLPILATSRLV